MSENEIIPEASGMCPRCTMPIGLAKNVLTESGCSYCDSWLKKFAKFDVKKGKNALDARIAEAEEKRKETDSPVTIIVPCSFGTDSTYVLWYIKSNYPDVKVLVVNFDNGYQSKVAKTNKAVISESIGVKVRTIDFDWNTQLKTMYKAMVEICGDHCSTCNCIGYSVIYRLILTEFSKGGFIPLIVSGWDPRSDDQPNVYFFVYAFCVGCFKEANVLRQAKKVFGSGVIRQFSRETDLRQATGAISSKINLAEYIPWDPVLNILKIEELGWDSGVENAVDELDKMHSDCDFHFMLEWIAYVRFGMTQWRFKVAAAILSGQLTYEEAVEKIKKRGVVKKPENYDEFCRKLGVKDFNENGLWITQRPDWTSRYDEQPIE